MDRNTTIGNTLKNMRLERKITLKQLGEATGLSTGYLSQLERGMTSIAIETLSQLADFYGASLAGFFDQPAGEPADRVVHSFELVPVQISEQIIQFILSKQKEQFMLLPRLFQLMPFADSSDSPGMYHHEGEEFIYVLEGIVTVYLQDTQYTLYPGDSIQIHSSQDHNWINHTNKIAKLLSINFPNPFQPDSPTSRQPE